MFAKIENDVVVEWPVLNIKARFPNTSFPTYLTDVDLPEGFVLVHSAPSPAVGHHEKLIEVAPVKDGNRWVQGWSVVDMTEEEKVVADEQRAIAARAERNAKLSASDWTQVADAPVDKQAWAGYRQALRDITAQAGFPWNVQWPEQP
jgi:hypothetical protein